MAFQVGNYAKVWEISTPDKGDFMEGRISTSRKKDDEYEQDFSAYVRFIGEAKKKVKKIDEKDVIILKEIAVTNRYDKKAKTTYTNYAVFDFELPENDSKKSKKSKK